MSLADKPAFPVALPNQQRGMTLLEHYAGLAMQGLIANDRVQRDRTTEKLADYAVLYARALIAELEKQS